MNNRHVKSAGSAKICFAMPATIYVNNITGDKEMSGAQCPGGATTLTTDSVVKNTISSEGSIFRFRMPEKIIKFFFIQAC